jgi:hypothetical protein
MFKRETSKDKLAKTGVFDRLQEMQTEKKVALMLENVETEASREQLKSLQSTYANNVLNKKNNRVMLESYRMNVFNDVFKSSLYNIYEGALLIDDDAIANYRSSLIESFEGEYAELTKGCNRISDFNTLFENATPIVRQFLSLSENIARKKLCEAVAACEKDNMPMSIPDEVYYNDSDLNIIKAVNDLEGAKDYSSAISNKMVEVMKNEQDRADEEKERAEEIAQKVANKAKESGDETSMEESASSYLAAYSIGPQSLFHSIVVGQSKSFLSENTNISDNKNEILGNAICVYTMLETFNTLGLVKYDVNDIKKMSSNFYYNK